MRVQVLQHVPYEGLGSIASWLESQKATTSYARFFEAARLPSPHSVDMVIALGGPMSVNDEDVLPWLISEKQFIRDAILRDIPVLGVCLGAQLIAGAMGANVYRNPVKEIGWFPVRAVPAATGNFRLPADCTVFHWHGETFDLPPGAVRLASSDGCKNQAFQINRNVIGLQFHLEATPESVSALVENCRDELVPGDYVQSEAELRAAPVSSFTAINTVMNQVLAYLIRDSSRQQFCDYDAG